MAEFLGVCEEVGKWPEPLRAGAHAEAHSALAAGLPHLGGCPPAGGQAVGWVVGPGAYGAEHRAAGRKTLRGA